MVLGWKNIIYKKQNIPATSYNTFIYVKIMDLIGNNKS